MPAIHSSTKNKQPIKATPEMAHQWIWLERPVGHPLSNPPDDGEGRSIEMHTLAIVKSWSRFFVMKRSYAENVDNRIMFGYPLQLDEPETFRTTSGIDFVGRRLAIGLYDIDYENRTSHGVRIVIIEDDGDLYHFIVSFSVFGELFT